VILQRDPATRPAPGIRHLPQKILGPVGWTPKLKNAALDGPVRLFPGKHRRRCQGGRGLAGFLTLELLLSHADV
jgi:hypothetical protein